MNCQNTGDKKEAPNTSSKKQKWFSCHRSGVKQHHVYPQQHQKLGGTGVTDSQFRGKTESRTQPDYQVSKQQWIKVILKPRVCHVPFYKELLKDMFHQSKD